MIAKLYDSFGMYGILSIVTWVAVVVLLGVYLCKKRPRYCLLALAVAIAAGWLAGVNSDRVSAIRLDHRGEIAAELSFFRWGFY